jgi:hypothetical protein
VIFTYKSSIGICSTHFNYLICKIGFLVCSYRIPCSRYWAQLVLLQKRVDFEKVNLQFIWYEAYKGYSSMSSATVSFGSTLHATSKHPSHNHRTTRTLSCPPLRAGPHRRPLVWSSAPSSSTAAHCARRSALRDTRNGMRRRSSQLGLHRNERLNSTRTGLPGCCADQRRCVGCTQNVRAYLRIARPTHDIVFLPYNGAVRADGF